jgi:hypothetical protein
MDTDREIKAIQKLIPSASGERLKYLNDKLTALLKKKMKNEPDNV